jgi:hypothetical protein
MFVELPQRTVVKLGMLVYAQPLQQFLVIGNSQ